jgi:hypothetical protein
MTFSIREGTVCLRCDARLSAVDLSCCPWRQTRSRIVLILLLTWLKDPFALSLLALLEVSGNLGANLSAGTSDNVWNVFSGVRNE